MKKLVGNFFWFYHFCTQLSLQVALEGGCLLAGMRRGEISGQTIGSAVSPFHYHRSFRFAKIPIAVYYLMKHTRPLTTRFLE